MNNIISKISKYITYTFVYFLLLCTYSHCIHAASVGDFLPVGAQLTLPQGFRPHPAPNKPMLLPFVTPAPNSPSGGWKPIVANKLVPAQNTHMPSPMPPLPALQVCIDSDTEKEQSVEQQEGPLLESVVYGTWKPERPLSPDEMQTSTAPTTRSGELTTTADNRGRPSSGRKDLFSASKFVYVNFTQTSESKLVPTTESHQTTASTVKFINVKIDDENLLEISKQKNNSFRLPTSLLTEPSKKPTSDQKTTTSLRSEFASDPEATTEPDPLSIDVKKAWPTDIILTLEKVKHKQNAPKNFNYSFEGDTSALNQFNASILAETLRPQIPLNITKVGVPYENGDSAEKPSICVPIALIEQLSQIEIERVYCFPLPPYTLEASKSKKIKLKVDNYTEYGAVNAGEKSHISFIQFLNFSLLSMHFLRQKCS